MIKVLLIAYACEPYKGSEPGVGWNWAIHLSKYCDATVITRANNRSSIEHWITNNPNLSIGLKFYYVDLPKLFIALKKFSGVWLYYFLWQLGVYLFIRKRLNKNNYAVVHHITFMSNKINVVPFLGIRNVVGPVGGLEILPKGFYLFTGHPIKEYFRMVLIKRYRTSPFYNYYMAKINRLVLTSRHNIPLINKKYHRKIGIMQIGVNHTRRPINNTPPKTAKTTELYWGGILERWKGLELLLRSLMQVKNDFHLSITGKGRDESYFRQILKESSIESKVTFHGWVDQSRLNEIKNSIDIFVFTSLRETTGSILLEMMGMGTPCIVLDTGGPSEICTNENSLKIRVSNVSQVIFDLSKSLDYLIDHPTERERIGIRAYEEIAESYNWGVIAKTMSEYYQDLLNEDPSSSQ